jgi:CRP/FNR family transcriptional regulator, cyclic AMP receptor protein
MGLEGFERFAVTYKPGELIFCEFEPGDAFYLIQEGRVQISRIMGDIEKTVDVLKPGEIFGEMAILEEAPRSATAIAIEAVKCLEFNRGNFDALMRGNPQIALKLLKLFTKRIYDQRRRFMILTLDDTQARVADVFLMLNEANPEPEGGTDERIFRTTAEDVAHWAGLSVDETKHVLNHFVSQRRLEIHQDRIILKNINEFVRYVGSKRKQ